MTKEQLIDLLQKEEVDLTTLTKEDAYIFSISVGNTPKDCMLKFFNNFSDKLRELGIDKFIIIPKTNDEGLVGVFKVKDGEIECIK